MVREERPKEMSVLQSTYYEELLELDRYGNPEEPARMAIVHVAATFYEHVHISLETIDDTDLNSIVYAEINLTIENAEAILAGLKAAIGSARKGRDLVK